MPLVNPYVVSDNDRTIVNGYEPGRPLGGEVLAVTDGGGIGSGLDGAGDWTARLAADQVALLERLADGQTIAAAAAAEWMSLRTANRRVAELRTMLGLSSTREVVAAYVKHRKR